MADRHETEFPPHFFARDDDGDDGDFYAFDRFVTHIDDGAIAAVRALYQQLGVCGPDSGSVLDICSSWISHFPIKPERLVITGMNANELAANEMADEWSVKDLNVDPGLPYADAEFAAVTCAVSVDYLTRPLDVFAEVVRVLRPGGVFVCTFSNRCFPTKAIRGWLANDDRGRVQIVGRYFQLTDGFGPPVGELRNNGAGGDPLYGVWAERQG
ncbi:MAG: methyltransferase domain-containing protein [Actinomycetota bacterium]